MKKTWYYISTGILSFIMLFSAYNYIFNHEMLVQAYMFLGYPAYLLYPSAILKLAGVCVLWFSHNKKLLEWVYAGFTYLLILAFFAHVMAGDGQFLFAFVAFVALLVSYVTKEK